MASYRLHALAARNPAQRLSATFGASGAEITTGSERFTLGLAAFGRAGALRTLAPVSPVATGNRVAYAHRAVREVWTNGPLGLEQTFVVARRPAGAGALTLAVAVPAGAGWPAPRSCCRAVCGTAACGQSTPAGGAALVDAVERRPGRPERR